MKLFFNRETQEEKRTRVYRESIGLYSLVKASNQRLKKMGLNVYIHNDLELISPRNNETCHMYVSRKQVYEATNMTLEELLDSKKYINYGVFTPTNDGFTGVYIGKTSDFGQRCADHKKDARDDYKPLYETMRNVKCAIMVITKAFNTDEYAAQEEHKQISSEAERMFKEINPEVSSLKCYSSANVFEQINQEGEKLFNQKELKK